MHSQGLRIRLLGGFDVKVGEGAVKAEAWNRRKPATLVKILALAPGHRVHREQLMDHLWPELDASAGGANLRKAIFQARSALDAVSQGAAGLIEFGGDVVSLASEDLEVDADSFRSALAMARRSGAIESYRKALSHYGGPLLPDDAYEDWAAQPRRELHEEYVAALGELADLLEADGDVAGSTEAVRLLVAAEPTREESHVTLMRLYALAGRRGDALRQYDLLAEALDQELGMEPGVNAQRLREEINARHSDEPELTAELWERVGDLRFLSGDGTGAAKAYTLALQSGPPDDATGRVERKCAEAWLVQHRPDMAVPHLEQAEKHPSDRAEKGRLLRARANLAWESGQIPAAQSLAEQARAIATEAGAPEDLAAALEAVAIVSHFQGEWRQGLESELERLASKESDVGQLARVFDIHHCIGQYHLYGDELFGSVEGYARRILDRAEEVGALRAQAFAWCLLGETLLLQARWDESDGCLERSCHIHEQLGSRSGGLPWQRRAELAACRGRYDDAYGYLRRASGIATVSTMASHLWGRIHATAAFVAVEQGDPDRAVQSVQAAAAAAARYGDCPTCSALLNPVAAEAFALLGDREDVAYYAEAAGRVAGYFNSSALQAMAESAEASMARVEKDRPGARKHLDQARDLYEQAGQPYWAGRAERLAGLR